MQQQKATQVAISLDITSEYGPLRSVMVHRPGPEIDRLTLRNKKEMLFEDIPYLIKMQEEHRRFVDLLHRHGIEVVYLADRLKQVLTDESARVALVTGACRVNHNEAIAEDLLNGRSIEDLARILFHGLTAREFDGGERVPYYDEKHDYYLIDPIPNAYFMRDAAAVVGSGFVSCKMHHRVRIREAHLLQAVLRAGTEANSKRIIFGDVPSEDRPYTIEGGDIIVLSQKAVAIGCSERTREESIRRVAERLFERSRVERVYAISIPVAREFIHLDTVFTVIARGVVVAYPEVIYKVKEIVRYERATTIDGRVVAHPNRMRDTFLDLLREEFECDVTVIHTGGNDAEYAAREQYSDGTNCLAIAPGLVVSYDRNTHTNLELMNKGIRVETIEGSELVRGLGGPRCMTLPLRREQEGT